MAQRKKKKERKKEKVVILHPCQVKRALFNTFLAWLQRERERKRERSSPDLTDKKQPILLLFGSWLAKQVTCYVSMSSVCVCMACVWKLAYQAGKQHQKPFMFVQVLVVVAFFVLMQVFFLFFFHIDRYIERKLLLAQLTFHMCTYMYMYNSPPLFVTPFFSFLVRAKNEGDILYRVSLSPAIG